MRAAVSDDSLEEVQDAFGLFGSVCGTREKVFCQSRHAVLPWNDQNTSHDKIATPEMILDTEKGFLIVIVVHSLPYPRSVSLYANTRPMKNNEKHI